jgi:hypothetical protein
VKCREGKPQSINRYKAEQIKPQYEAETEASSLPRPWSQSCHETSTQRVAPAKLYLCSIDGYMRTLQNGKIAIKGREELTSERVTPPESSLTSRLFLSPTLDSSSCKSVRQTKGMRNAQQHNTTTEGRRTRRHSTHIHHI